jgi:nitrogen regulatory protein PII
MLIIKFEERKVAKMKIEAIVCPSKVGDVCAALEKVGHPRIMITEIEGHGN